MKLINSTKSAMKFMNSRKNKLKNLISYNFLYFTNMLKCIKKKSFF